MDNSTDNPGRDKPDTHWSVWVVGIMSLVWNLMGCANYLWQTTLGPEDLNALSEAQRSIIENRPAWATGGFAIAVFGGAAGSILLLLRKSAALIFFVLSLVGVIVSMIPVFGIMGTVNFSGFERIMYLILTPLVAAFLVWFTRLATRQNWIGAGRLGNLS